MVVEVSEAFFKPETKYVGGSKLENPPVEVGIKKCVFFDGNFFEKFTTRCVGR